MNAINIVKTGTSIIPEISDGVFHAAVAVIPEKITAMVNTTAAQNPNDDILNCAFGVDSFFTISKPPGWLDLGKWGIFSNYIQYHLE